MTADEALAVIEDSARSVLGIDTALFSVKVREDLALYRRQVAATDRTPDDPPESRLAFRVPERYREEGELWIVFSSFVSTFLDPISVAQQIVKTLPELPAVPTVERVVMLSELDATDQSDELEVLDADRLATNLREMIDIAALIGREFFGDSFSISDFLYGETDDRG